MTENRLEASGEVVQTNFSAQGHIKAGDPCLSGPVVMFDYCDCRFFSNIELEFSRWNSCLWPFVLSLCLQE